MNNFMIALLLCLCATVANAAPQGPLDACIGYRKAGQLPQAITLCEQATRENPVNAKAWYEYGETLIEVGRYGDAESAWSSAVRLNKEYAKRVGTKYETALEGAVKSGQIGDASRLASRLVDYQPTRRLPIADKFQKEGLKLLSEGQREQAKAYFMTAVQLNPKLRKLIYDAYIAEGNKAPEEEAVFIWGDAIPYSDVRDQSIGKKILEIGDKYAVKPGYEQLVSRIRGVLREYMGEAYVSKYFSAVFEAPLGGFTFKGKAGERTPYDIVEAQPSQVLFSSDNKQYTIVYDNGQSFRMWIPSEVDAHNNFKSSRNKFYFLYEKDCVVYLELKYLY